MDNSFKTCPYCGSVGAADHTFCARCGRPLGEPRPHGYAPTGAHTGHIDPAAQKSNTYTYNYGGQTVAYEDKLNDIPTAEVSDYIGNNRHKFLTKFFRQSFGARGGWNWIVFILGLLGVPFVWFFYRKMYKQGAAVLGISLALVLCSALISGGMLYYVRAPLAEYCEQMVQLNEEYGYYDNYDFNVPFAYPDDSNSSYTKEANGIYDTFLAQTAENDAYAALSMLSEIVPFLNLAFILIVTIYADHWYYKKAMADLKRLNQNGTPESHTVVAAGGTKTSAAVLSAILGVLASGAVSAAAVLPFALKLFETIF